MTIEQVREKFKGAYVFKYEKAKKSEFYNKYMSNRNSEDISLVCQELNVLTVEDYCKWYGLYYLMEDPDTNEIMLVTLTFGDIIDGIDNDYYPDSVIKFCISNDIKIDEASYLCICKMMINDNMAEILDIHLPKINDLVKVIKHNTQSISETFHVYKYDNAYSYCKHF